MKRQEFLYCTFISDQTSQARPSTHPQPHYSKNLQLSYHSERCQGNQNAGDKPSQGGRSQNLVLISPYRKWGDLHPNLSKKAVGSNVLPLRDALGEILGGFGFSEHISYNPLRALICIFCSFLISPIMSTISLKRGRSPLAPSATLVTESSLKVLLMIEVLATERQKHIILVSVMRWAEELP